MIRRILQLALLLSAVALAACGSKGPLVQPDQAGAAKKKPAATQPAPPADPAKP